MCKKKIKIKFVDFWKAFDETDNFIVRSLLKKYVVEYSEEPDFLFYSSFGSLHWKYNSCVKIFFTGENICPDFNACDYALGFERMDYGDRYLRYPGYLLDKYLDSYKKMQVKHLGVSEEMFERKFCSFVYSNSRAAEIRDEFFENLSQYKQVDSGGRWKNNTESKKGVENKVDFLNSHKFDIAIENSSHVGYTTEKIVESFAAQTIPIYWGDPRIELEFNKNAMINISDFEDLESAIEFIKLIDEDRELYLNMLKQPALSNQCLDYESYDAQLTEFLENIVECKHGKYRRNMDFWGKIYYEENKMKDQIITFLKRKKVKKIVNFVLERIYGY